MYRNIEHSINATIVDHSDQRFHLSSASKQNRNRHWGLETDDAIVSQERERLRTLSKLIAIFVSGSWVSLFKEQVDRVQALGEMAGKELVVYGTRFFDSNQDSIQLSADRPTGNETLILPEIDISDQWEHIRQQILMLQTSQTT